MIKTDLFSTCHIKTVMNYITLLECFSAPEAGVYRVSVYEIQHGGTVGHKVWNLLQIIIGKNSTEESIAGEGQGIYSIHVFN